MTDFYAKEFVGVRDGSTLPPAMADSRIVDAKKRCTRAVKDNINAIAANDRLYIGRLPLGAIVKNIHAITDTSLGAVTVSVGTAATPAKYVNAKTVTTTDVPTPLGPNAAAALADPLTAIEEIWVTFSGAVPAAVMLGFNTEFTISA